jgi:ADP-heptose:LPS heptosyltransferase
MLFFFIGCIKQTNPNNSFDLIAYKYFELIKKLCKVYDI